MDYIRLIPQLSGESFEEDARYYEYCGADEIYFDARMEDGEINYEGITQIATLTDAPVMVCANPEREEDFKDIFKAGASRIVLTSDCDVNGELAHVIKKAGQENVFLLMEAADMDDCLIQARTAVEEEGFGGIVLQGDSADLSLVQTADFLQVKVNVPVLLFTESTEPATVARLLKMTMGYGLIFQSAEQIDLPALKCELQKEGLPVNTLVANFSFEDFKLNSDGMIPVVTQDYYTKKVLMLAYMTKESFEKTIESGKMTYFSRSRQELWCKGDTSGHYQYVKSLEIDCDNDTILAKVAQVGAACHTGHYSCFYRNLAGKGY